MTFNVLEDINIETPEGLVTLNKGQIIKLSKDEAIPFIEAGIIAPIEQVAYKVYSDSLGCYLWIVESPEHKKGLRGQNITEAIYTFQETQLLKGTDRELLNAVQQIKKIFKDSEVTEYQNIVNSAETEKGIR
jgi:hypothetical protein